MVSEAEGEDVWLCGDEGPGLLEGKVPQGPRCGEDASNSPHTRVAHVATRLFDATPLLQLQNKTDWPNKIKINKK